MSERDYVLHLHLYKVNSLLHLLSPKWLFRHRFGTKRCYKEEWKVLFKNLFLFTKGMLKLQIMAQMPCPQSSLYT